MAATLKFIGYIETPYQTLAECPDNARADGPECHLILDPSYAVGMVGLGRGQKILILYWLEGSDRTLILQEGRGRSSGELYGAFALRSPHRPNPIGAAVLPIEKLDQGRITVRGLDCLNGTRLLDIKPEFS